MKGKQVCLKLCFILLAHDPSASLELGPREEVVLWVETGQRTHQGQSLGQTA